MFKMIQYAFSYNYLNAKSLTSASEHVIIKPYKHSSFGSVISGHLLQTFPFQANCIVDVGVLLMSTSTFWTN